MVGNDCKTKILNRIISFDIGRWNLIFYVANVLGYVGFGKLFFHMKIFDVCSKRHIFRDRTI